MSEQKCRKVYVPVNLDVDAEGNIRPRLIRWIDGRVYEIDRLKHKCRAASTKVGGCGIRYTVMIGGHESFLFNEDEKWFIEPENIRKLCGKRRFTLAHECAHQILFQLDADDRKIACHKRPEVRKKGSRVLRTQEDWNEWQANSLGAAILMPQSEVDRAMWFINSRKPLTCYGWRFYNKDQVKIDTFCGVFGVSRSAAAIRLEQLGYLNRKKDYEYRDPLEVWP